MSIVALVVLAGVIVGVVALVQRGGSKTSEPGGGADIVAYLVLAVAMGTAGFALAELASTAFPGDRFVFDPASELATALSALAVSVPFLVYFWNRQQARRYSFPESAGWTVYLALIELVFMTAFVISAVVFVDGLIGPKSASAWTGALVFGLIVGFHELAVSRTPPGSDSAELPRVIGSAIGLITLFIGTSGSLIAFFSQPFSALDFPNEPWPAMLIVGAAVWAYRWFRPWPEAQPSVPRVVWLTVVSIASMALALASVIALLALTFQYLLVDTQPAEEHFQGAPVAMGILIASLPTWWVHRRAMGSEPSDPIRAYAYAVSGIGLAAAVVSVSGLTISAFSTDQLVSTTPTAAVAWATVALCSASVWLGFLRQASIGDAEGHTPWPRRFYHLGLGIVFGLIAAGSLITTLFIVLERIFDGGGQTGLLEPVAIFIYAGLATWYLIAGWMRDRNQEEVSEVVLPFSVTLITSHPGRIATLFPAQARLKVIYRGDQYGVVDDETAAAIVEAVGESDSIVWVDEDGFRVAPGRPA